ncbi:MOSC domain-containing protein [Bacillus sp. DTU_2020_1000418_1_SI_GHA_SEK_038]|uniref:MOSC domain-containing protein n=1 Tax=Bacillus sp. DTU_2020_1000418_1_SI_GHA_SEK_038 TaxID=3077585 RepID=UPI0028F07144|nr:MOSC domain-containing protein [Bacillus sp. DTU_2020_1000418_1_SI_GHA_SEK_038]WNS73808.1 MOSC domain-containing protein [Bacillus sp. DTU_2020_1000418_1_SI_GHA_SEK_038]
MGNQILALNIGRPNLHLWDGVTFNSAIRKRPVSEVLLTKDGFKGDSVGNPEVHGGPDRAVCLYPIEHYEQWENEFQKPFQMPAFGENISVADHQEKDVYIGDIFSLGEAIIQVSQGRVPCTSISKHNKAENLLSRVVETGYTGYFFRVLQEGIVKADSSLTLMERRQEKFSVLAGNQLMFHDRKNREAIEELIQLEELAEVWRNRLMKAL